MVINASEMVINLCFCSCPGSGEDPPEPPGSGEDPPGPPGSGEDLEILEKTWSSKINIFIVKPILISQPHSTRSSNPA